MREAEESPGGTHHGPNSREAGPSRTLHWWWGFKEKQYIRIFSDYLFQDTHELQREKQWLYSGGNPTDGTLAMSSRLASPVMGQSVSPPDTRQRRAQKHWWGIPTSNAQPQPRHKASSDKPRWRHPRKKPSDNLQRLPSTRVVPHAPPLNSLRVSRKVSCSLGKRY